MANWQQSTEFILFDLLCSITFIKILYTAIKVSQIQRLPLHCLFIMYVQFLMLDRATALPGDVIMTSHLTWLGARLRP